MAGDLRHHDHGQDIPLDDIAAYVNETALFRNQWQFRPDKTTGETINLSYSNFSMNIGTGVKVGQLQLDAVLANWSPPDSRRSKSKSESIRHETSNESASCGRRSARISR